MEIYTHIWSLFLIISQFQLVLCLVVQNGENLINIANSQPSGTFLEVQPGDYAGGSLTQDGIYIIAQVNGTVKMSSILGINANGLIISGLLFENLDGMLISIYGHSNIIRYCHFREFGRSTSSKGIWIRESGNYHSNVIEHNIFEDWGNTAFHSSCIKIGQTGFPVLYTDTIVRKNLIQNGESGGNSCGIQPFFPTLIEGNTVINVEDGIEVKGSNNIIRKNHVIRTLGAESMSNRAGDNNLFENNVLEEIDMYAWQIWVGSNNTFRHNIIFDSGRIAHIKGGEGTGNDMYGADHIYLLHNTFINNNRGISWDLKERNPTNIFFKNNIFVGDGSSEIEGSVDLYEEDYNIFFDFDYPAAFPGDHSIFVEPIFVEDGTRTNLRMKNNFHSSLLTF